MSEPPDGRTDVGDGANRRPRVLVVDDDRDIAEVLADVLREEGYEVQVAFDAGHALRLADEKAPKVAFLDLELPVMDGCELARRLRATPVGGEIRLIAFTAYGHQDDHARTVAAGFDLHLVKPATLELILQAVGQASPQPAPARCEPP